MSADKIKVQIELMGDGTAWTLTLQDSCDEYAKALLGPDVEVIGGVFGERGNRSYRRAGEQGWKRVP